MMYNGYTIKEREENSATILKCLAVFNIWHASEKSKDQPFRDDGWDMFVSYGIETQDEKDEAIRLKNEGQRYYNLGYRLKQTGRKLSGVSIPVPDEAIAWVAVDAGYIATSSAFKIEYVIHLSSETMTPSQIEAEFNLSSGTVRQYLKNHSEELTANKEAWKADSRTWLLLRTTAERIWKVKNNA